MNEPSLPPSPLRVLVVDDEIDSADTFAELLRAYGYEVRVAYDGASALDMGPAWRPHVIFLDVALPAMDGYEVARQLRARDGELPRIIALSGFGRPIDHERSISAGCEEHLVKPPQLGDILRILAKRI